MKLAIGTVVNGMIVLEGDGLPEGTVVTVLATEGDEGFAVPLELEQELDESIVEAARGEAITAAEALSRYDIYYHILPQRVVVLAFWHAGREVAPKL